MVAAWGRVANSFSDLTQTAHDGFDFSLPLPRLITDLGDDDFARLQTLRGEEGISLDVCMVPLPASITVTEPGFNLYLWMENLKSHISRISALGCRTLLWNNGFARMIPEEGSIARAKDQVLHFLNLLGGIAEDFGMQVLIEPLSPDRTNFLNTLPETVDFLSQVNRPAFSCALSTGELDMIGLTPADLAGSLDMVSLVLLGKPLYAYDGTIEPGSWDPDTSLALLDTLKAAGYTGMFCLPADAVASDLVQCREHWRS